MSFLRENSSVPGFRQQRATWVLIDGQLPDDNCRVSGDHAIVFKFAAYHSAGADNTVIAQNSSFKNQAVAADKAVFADGDFACADFGLVITNSGFCLDGMKIIVQNLCIAADLDSDAPDKIIICGTERRYL